MIFKTIRAYTNVLKCFLQFRKQDGVVMASYLIWKLTRSILASQEMDCDNVGFKLSWKWTKVDSYCTCMCHFDKNGKTKSNVLNQISFWPDSTLLYEKILLKNTTEQNEAPDRKVPYLYEILANNYFRDFGRAIFCDTYLTLANVDPVCLTFPQYKLSNCFFATSNFRDSKSQKTRMNHC